MTGYAQHWTEPIHWALEHFFHADKQNAAIHCAKVQFSPITFRLAEILDAEFGSTNPIVVEVMSHKGQYAEDPGR